MSRQNVNFSRSRIGIPTRDRQRSASRHGGSGGEEPPAHSYRESHLGDTTAVHAYLQELGSGGASLEYRPSTAYQEAFAHNLFPSASFAPGYAEQAPRPTDLMSAEVPPMYDSSFPPPYFPGPPAYAFAQATEVADDVQPWSAQTSNIMYESPRMVQPFVPGGDDLSPSVSGADTFHYNNVAYPGGETADYAPFSFGFDTPNASFDAPYRPDDFNDGFRETYAAPSRVPQRHNTSCDSTLPTVAPHDSQTQHYQEYFGPGRRTQEPESLAMIYILQEDYMPQGRTSLVKQPSLIDFRINGVGVSLRDVLNGSADLPEDWANCLRDTPGFERQKITLRLLWRGYPKQNVQLNVMNFAADHHHVSTVKLLTNVAKSIKIMMETCASYTMTSDGILPIREGDFDRVLLLSLRHVSTGSWQPELCMTVPA